MIWCAMRAKFGDYVVIAFVRCDTMSTVLLGIQSSTFYFAYQLGKLSKQSLQKS